MFHICNYCITLKILFAPSVFEYVFNKILHKHLAYAMGAVGSGPTLTLTLQ